MSIDFQTFFVVAGVGVENPVAIFCRLTSEILLYSTLMEFKEEKRNAY